MNLLMLAVIKKAIDEQNRSHIRHRRKGAKAPEKRGTYSLPIYSENEFLTLVISEDPILKAFFKVIEEKGKEIDKQDAEKIKKEIETKLEEQAGRVDKINKIKDELEKLGVTLTSDIRIDYGITVGKKVIKLKRERFAFFDLKGLNVGEYRRLSNKEIAVIYSLVK